MQDHMPAAARSARAGWELEVSAMRAEVGDEIIVRGHHVGDEDRRGVITEVHGQGGAPPYLVRWDNGHQSVFMPSSDSVVEHHPAPRAAG
jgi:Domain of unknown function (DUF1918)